MKGINSGRDLLPMRLFSGPKTTIQALETSISRALIVNNQKLTVARPQDKSVRSLLDALHSGLEVIELFAHPVDQ
jgi:hypothetical protein